MGNDKDGAEVERLSEHTINPTDVKLTEKQVKTIGNGGVLLLEHAVCGEPIRLWKEVDDE